MQRSKCKQYELTCARLTDQPIFNESGKSRRLVEVGGQARISLERKMGEGTESTETQARWDDVKTTVNAKRRYENAADKYGGDWWQHSA